MDTETAKPAHLDGGGGLREFEQLGGRLEITNSANDSETQARALESAFDNTALTATTSDTLEQGSATPAPSSPRAPYTTRLDAKSPARVTNGACRECRAKFTAQRATKEFCSTACRQAFNNRKMIRGAAIYSLAMEWRADRSDKTALNLLCRLLAEFRSDDERAGRRSWDSAASVIRDKPYLTATLLDTNLAGMRRTGRGK
jgi:hypothetical protein